MVTLAYVYNATVRSRLDRCGGVCFPPTLIQRVEHETRFVRKIRTTVKSLRRGMILLSAVTVAIALVVKTDGTDMV